MGCISNTEMLIHIGHHKAGSTFLQKKIFPLIPANLIMAPDVTYIAESKDYKPQQFIENMEQYFTSSLDKTILSQEVLSGRGDGNLMWDRLLIGQRLKQTFPNAKVLIVIREQLDYILSLYTFRVIQRGLERQNLSDYLEEKFEKRLMPKLRYYGLVKSYIELFGADNVLVLPYEQLVENSEAFVREIFEFMDIETIPEFTNSKVNKGIRDSRIVLANRIVNCPISATIDFLRRNKMLTQKQFVLLAKCYFKLKSIVLNSWTEKVFHNPNYTIDFV